MMKIIGKNLNNWFDVFIHTLYIMILVFTSIHVLILQLPEGKIKLKLWRYFRTFPCLCIEIINRREVSLTLSVFNADLLVREFYPKLWFFADFLYTSIINFTGRQLYRDGRESDAWGGGAPCFRVNEPQRTNAHSAAKIC
jgi:hypothetical protein